MNATMAEQMKANLKDHVAELQPFFDALIKVAKRKGFSLTPEEVSACLKHYLPLKPYERNMLIDTMLKDEVEELVSYIMIPDKEYDEFMSRVMAMPPRKRKNFKSTLTDKDGTSTKLIYDGELKNYCLQTRKFVPVKSKSMVFTDFDSAKFKPTSKVGYEIAQGKDMNEVMADANAESHTGNHTGRINHHIKIPAPSTW